MDGGRFSGKVAELLRAAHDGAAQAPAADRQDAVAVALQTDPPAFDVTGVDDIRPPPIVRERCEAPAPILTYVAPRPRLALPSLSLVECEARVRKYLAMEVAAYLGLGFEDVFPIVEGLPEHDQWAFECPAGWTEIVHYVSERLLGKRPDFPAGPIIH